MNIGLLILLVIIIIGLTLVAVKIILYRLEMRKVQSILDYYKKKIDENMKNKDIMS